MDFVQTNKQNIEERKRYFRLHLLHSMVVNIVYNKGKKFQGHPSSHGNSEDIKMNFDVKYFAAMSAALTQLQTDPSVQYMGLEKECFRSSNRPLKQKFSAVVTTGDIKHAVKDFSLKVLSYHGESKSNLRPSREVAFSHLSKVSKSLSIEKEEMRLLKINVEETKQDQELIKSCFQETTLCMDLLSEMLKTFQNQVEVYPVLSTYYYSKIKAVLFKIKNLNLELLKKTYRKKVVLALTRIHEQLLIWKRELEQSYMEKSVALKTYKSAGSALELLAKEYSRLQTAIKNEKWAIQEIEKAEKENPYNFG